MTFESRLKLTLVVLLAFLSTMTPMEGQSGSAKPLQFIAKPSKTVFRVGEKIEFIVTLTNVSNEPILVSRSFRMRSFLGADITGPIGKVNVCRYLGDAPPEEKELAILQPRASVTAKVSLACVPFCSERSHECYDFSSPGRYTISLKYFFSVPKDWVKLKERANYYAGPVVSDSVEINLVR
jgi:hypothetical protein